MLCILQLRYNVSNPFYGEKRVIQHKYGRECNKLIEVQGFFKESIAAFIFINIFATC